MSAQNVQIVRTLFDLWHTGDVDAAFANYDVEVIWDRAWRIVRVAFRPVE